MATTPPDVLQYEPAQKPASLKWWQLVTFLLIGLNVLVFLVMVFSGVGFFDPTADSVLKWGADYGPYVFEV